MQDIDDFDPLEDLLLSDEDLPESKIPVEPTLSYHHVPNDSDLNGNLKKEKKKKIIAELFGNVDDEQKPTEKPELAAPLVQSNKSDWLELKVEKTDPSLANTYADTTRLVEEAIVSPNLSAIRSSTGISLESDDGVERKDSHFVNDKIERNKTERLSRSSIDDVTSSGLSKPTTRFKSLDLDLFNLDSSFISEKNSQLSQMWNRDVAARDNLTKEKQTGASETRENDDQGVNSYIPSTRHVNRRFASNQLKNFRLEEHSRRLSSFMLDDGRKVSSSDIKDESVPTWLKVEKDVQIAPKSNSFNDETETVTRSALEKSNVENISSTKPDPSGQEAKRHQHENELKNNLKTDGIHSEVECSSRNEIEKDDEHNITPSLAVLKKKQTELKQLTENKTESMRLLEQEIQDTAVQLIRDQHDNWRALLQILNLDRSVHENRLPITSFHREEKESERVNIISELQMRLNKEELEKAEVEMKLKYSERKHIIDLAMLEDVYKCKLQIADEKQEHLIREIQDLENECYKKLDKEKEEKNELIRTFNEKIKALKEEHFNELKHMTERQSLKNPRRMLSDLPTDELQASGPAANRELVLREIAVEEKYKELSELEDRLNRQKQSLDGKEIDLNTRVEEFELKIVKERTRIDGEKKEVKLAQIMLEERQTCFQRDIQVERNCLTNYKQELETMKEQLIREEGKLMKEKFETCAERARIEAFTNADGNGGSVQDIIQNQAAIQGTIDELRKLKSKLEFERNEVKMEQMRLKEERWRLRDIEQELRFEQKNLEKILSESETKREEGMDALRKARRIESQLDERMQTIEKRASELNKEEKSLTQDRIQLSKERDLLMKKRYQLDMMLPQLSYDEQMPFNLLNKNLFDPRIKLMKLLAESTENVYST